MLDFRPFQTIFSKVHINFSPALQWGGWVEGGGEGWVGVEGGGGEGKTRGHWLPTDGPDDATRPKGHHSCQG